MKKKNVLLQATFFLLWLPMGCVAFKKRKIWNTYKENLRKHRVHYPRRGESMQAKKKSSEFVAFYSVNRQLEELLNHCHEEQKKGTTRIYTIQLYQGKSRKKALFYRSQFYLKYPDQKVTISHDNLHYCLFTGIFSEILEAFQHYEKLRKQFPKAILRPHHLSNEPSLSKKESSHVSI